MQSAKRKSEHDRDSLDEKGLRGGGQRQTTGILVSQTCMRMERAYRNEGVKGGPGNKKKSVETACEQERQGINVELPLQVGAHLSSPIS